MTVFARGQLKRPLNGSDFNIVTAQFSAVTDRGDGGVWAVSIAAERNNPAEMTFFDDGWSGGVDYISRDLNDVTVKLMLQLVGPRPSAIIDLDGSISAGAGATTDYGGTSGLKFNLPPGATFTSASGVFLTPIPGGAILLASALGLVVSASRWSRRRGRTPASCA